MTIETIAGEQIELVCYAFLANRYKQGGRPSDEHRFQIKYGSNFKEYHRLFIDPTGETVTLFFGVHLDEEIVVAADPVANNPTWFSKSIEFKDENIDAVKSNGGWAGWERHRVDGGRRKKQKPELNLQTEALVGLTPEHFGRLVMLERASSGMPSSERIALIEAHHPDNEPEPHNLTHTLARAFHMDSQTVLDLIASDKRLMVAMRGSVAEWHLERYLHAHPDVSRIEPALPMQCPDFKVHFRGKPLGIECKNILRRSRRPKVDFQRTRAPKANPCGRYYMLTRFDLLAACTEPLDGKWAFQFCPLLALDAHPKCPDRAHPAVYLDANEGWTQDLSRAAEHSLSLAELRLRG